MAKARMLHKKISVSSQVNKLPLPARHLFTWMIPHADDEGRLRGEPDHVKATVVPMTKWSFKKIEEYLELIKTIGLIHRWADIEKGECYIEFVKWKEHQSIKSDRFKSSDLPSYKSRNGDEMSPKSIQTGSSSTPQSNISESNEIKVNTSEYKEPIADKSSFNTPRMINPKSFKPNNEGEVAAFETWKLLEPYNPFAFKTTYLKALKRGLPPRLFHQFTSEIKQDSTIKNPGAVFNKKVEDYFTGQRR